ncbi:MAG: methyltransferase domain-containing protein [Candidatus Woesearchaeota archaeon]
MRENQNPLYETLACPTCKTGIDTVENGLYCRDCDTLYQNGPILSLFPIVKDPRSFGRSFLGFSDMTCGKVVVSSTSIKKLLETGMNKDIRGADFIIDLVYRENSKDGKLDPNLVSDVVKCLEEISIRCSSVIEPENRPFLNKAATLGRYEGELRAGSYIGGFVTPDEFLAILPKGARYLEVGMGPGDNLRKIKSAKSPLIMVGSDLSSSMVKRAIANFDQNSTLFLQADAEYGPFKTGAFDVGMIYNALDRIPQTTLALEELARVCGEYVVIGNCIPFQNRKQVRGGFEIVYVPEDQAVESIEQAMDKTGFKLQKISGPFPWNIKTIMDGEETLDVVVGLGKR